VRANGTNVFGLGAGVATTGEGCEVGGVFREHATIEITQNPNATKDLLRMVRFDALEMPKFRGPGNKGGFFDLPTLPYLPWSHAV